MSILVLYIFASLCVGFILCIIAGKKHVWVLQAAYVSVLLASLVTAAKLSPLTDTAVVSVAIGLYSMTFLLTDFIGEMHGKKEALKSVGMAIIGAFVLVFAVQFSVSSTPAAFYADQDAYAKILGAAPRMLLASVAAFVLAQLVDVHLFDKLKKITGDKLLFVRNNLSTFGGQTVDTVIFYTIAFWGIVPNVVELIVVTCLVKYVIAILDTPFLYLAKAITNRRAT